MVSFWPSSLPNFKSSVPTKAAEGKNYILKNQICLGTATKYKEGNGALLLGT
jgi:hypothetical protein